ncbi:MAG: hypothetical protein ACFFAS_20215 [Promethearchaeota archaeon]
MAIIEYLANVLSENIGISSLASRGLIKLAIKDQLNPYIDFNQLSFLDIENSIKHALKERLLKLNISEVNKIIDLLLFELKNNQSLIIINKI